MMDGAESSFFRSSQRKDMNSILSDIDQFCPSGGEIFDRIHDAIYPQWTKSVMDIIHYGEDQ